MAPGFSDECSAEWDSCRISPKKINKQEQKRRGKKIAARNWAKTECQPKLQRITLRNIMLAKIIQTRDRIQPWFCIIPRKIAHPVERGLLAWPALVDPGTLSSVETKGGPYLVRGGFWQVPNLCARGLRASVYKGRMCWGRWGRVLLKRNTTTADCTN